MKKKKMLNVFAILICIAIIMVDCINVGASDCRVVLADDILRAYGMPEERIAELDEDIKQYMVDSLGSMDIASEEIEYIEGGNVETPSLYVNQVLTGINFYCDSFLAGNRVRIYPTYEFTREIKPVGQDSFSVFMGDALIPYGYGGQVWYMDSTMDDWEVGGSMIANNQFSNGAEYSGNQLGSPSWSMKIKGCAYIDAQVGAGTSKQVILSYMHNPDGANYSLTFNAGAFGIAYNSSETIYSAARTFILDY